MWIKRGCCGLMDLRTQTMMIAGFYTVSNFTGQHQIFEGFNNFIMFSTIQIQALSQKYIVFETICHQKKNIKYEVQNRLN